ncbi:hypothetical protein M3Y97_00385700 [Aphelenchoides bicaudatus]|nr:hypothetical protein M3Y97_00385700 [Aphelenchoides bicaudatus]
MRGSTFKCPTSRVMHEIQTDTTLPREVQHEFLHYSLPRQKSRSEYDVSVIRTMPISSVPSIRIETSSVHLNDSEANVETEVISPPVVVPQVEITQEPEVHETYNEIHVDSLPSETKVETKELQNGSLVKNPSPSIEEPIPIKNKNGTLANGANGKVTNGTIHTEQSHTSVTRKSSVGRQIFVGILDFLVIVLLLSIIVIAVFEVVGPHEPAYFHPHISNFRRNVYNPLRSNVINRYNHLFY